VGTGFQIADQPGECALCSLSLNLFVEKEQKSDGSVRPSPSVAVAAVLFRPESFCATVPADARARLRQLKRPSERVRRHAPISWHAPNRRKPSSREPTITRKRGRLAPNPSRGSSKTDSQPMRQNSGSRCYSPKSSWTVSRTSLRALSDLKGNARPGQRRIPLNDAAMWGFAAAKRKAVGAIRSYVPKEVPVGGTKRVQ
jgi:hypothetical protein